MIQAIVAVDDKWGISKNEEIPWVSPGEIEFFRRITIGEGNNAVVMGRKTWESREGKPLRERTNFILTRDSKRLLTYDPYILIDIENLGALKLWDKNGFSEDFDDIFIIGGLEIYKQALEAKIVDQIHISHIPGDFDCDLFFPKELLAGILRYDYIFPVLKPLYEVKEQK